MSARILAAVDALLGLVIKEPTTGRSASSDFGPTPAARYPMLATLPDSLLLATDRDALIAAAGMHDEATLRHAMRPVTR